MGNYKSKTKAINIMIYIVILAVLSLGIKVLFVDGDFEVFTFISSTAVYFMLLSILNNINNKLLNPGMFSAVMFIGLIVSIYIAVRYLVVLSVKEFLIILVIMIGVYLSQFLLQKINLL